MLFQLWVRQFPVEPWDHPGVQARYLVELPPGAIAGQHEVSVHTGFALSCDCADASRERCDGRRVILALHAADLLPPRPPVA